LEKKAIKTRLDPKCWKGKKIGNPKTKVKGGVRVNNCVPMEEGLKSAIAKAALAGTLATTSPNVPSKAPNADKSVEQGKSFPSTVQVVVDKDGKRHKIYSENNEADKTEYRVQAIVQSLGAARKNYVIRVSASDEQQAITIANKKARAFGTVISSKLVDEE
jgi:hypothetical protein